jgi:photosystem II stability/assembly factor-like uncharacterized protein
MSFLDARHGFVYEGGGPTRLFRTSDGGRTWQRISRADNMPWQIAFVNREVGFRGAFLGLQGPYVGPPFVDLERTTDGGRTWSPYDVGGWDRVVELPIGVFGGRVVLAQNGPYPVSGLNLQAATVWVSDGHDAWAGRPVPFGQRDPPVMWFSAASARAWAIATARDVYLTADAGAHWRHVVLGGLPRDAGIGQIDFTSPRQGWAVIWGIRPWEGTLFRTTDGGLRWTPAGPLKPKTDKRG